MFDFVCRCELSYVTRMTVWTMRTISPIDDITDDDGVFGKEAITPYLRVSREQA